MSGDSSGIIRPVTIPYINDIANIQNGLKTFYYGSIEGAAATVEDDIPETSVAGRIIKVDNAKVNKTNGIANSPFTVLSSTDTSSLKLQTSGGTLNINTPTTLSGTTNITLPSSGTLVNTDINTLSSLSTIGNVGVATILLGSGSTTTFNIGNVEQTAPRTINIGTGASATHARTINIGSVTQSATHTINIGASGAAVNLLGTVSLPSTTSIGSVSSTQIGYLSTLSSNVQTQLNSLQSQINTKVPLLVTIDTKNAEYIITDADNGKIIEMSTATNIVLSGTPAIGTQVTVVRTVASGNVTFNNSGTIIYSTPGNTLRAQYSSATAVKKSSNEWYVFGDLTA